MMKNDENLCYIIDTTYGTMLECKSRIKNRAVLCNLTKCKPIIYNATYWTGKVDMLSQFHIIHDDLETALEHKDTTFAMNTSINYINRVKNRRKCFCESKYQRKKCRYNTIP